MLVRYSVPYSYRGFKALTAQQRGAAGLLIYSDPADDGYAKGKVYPEGPWGPESHIQRGGIVYDFLVPGDPLTPGWASVPGAQRASTARDAASLPEDRQRAALVQGCARDPRVIDRTVKCPRHGVARCRSQYRSRRSGDSRSCASACAPTIGSDRSGLSPACFAAPSGPTKS